MNRLNKWILKKVLNLKTFLTNLTESGYRNAPVTMATNAVAVARWKKTMAYFLPENYW
jgi:hypothetical protein